MSSQPTAFTTQQLTFKELFVGTLIYAVVLGFFNDYTSIVYAKSFSTIFLTSAVLEALTYLAFQLKTIVVRHFKARDGHIVKPLMAFSIWLIMFLSKFVFIGALDLLFDDYIHVNGFFGILFVVLAVTLIHTVADVTFKRLGRSN